MKKDTSHFATEEKTKIEEEISNTKKALEGTDIDAINAAAEKLTTAFYSVSEKLYQQAGAQAGVQTETEPQAAEANTNAGFAAVNQIIDFFETGNTKFQVNK